MSTLVTRCRFTGLVTGVALLVGALATPSAALAQSVAAKETSLQVRRALERLPYYGVFDFLAYSIDRGKVTLRGSVYNGATRSSAEMALKRVSGVDEVANLIEVLPASSDDERIRWETFFRIYTDDFLSRYAPGGAMAARYALQDFARYRGMQPFGTYPIHIIVKNRRVTLVGVVDNESDKTVATVRAREVAGTFGVENELMVASRGTR
jgi:osmotically-inducible protein OsmY